jgi:hypothetical protein
MYKILDGDLASVFKEIDGKWFFWSWTESFYKLLPSEEEKDPDWLPVLDKRLEEIVNKLPPKSATEVIEFVYDRCDREVDDWMKEMITKEIVEVLVDG